MPSNINITDYFKSQLSASPSKNWMADIGKISNLPKSPMSKPTDSFWGGLKAGAGKFMGKAGDEMKWLGQDVGDLTKTAGLTSTGGLAGVGEMAYGITDSFIKKPDIMGVEDQAVSGVAKGAWKVAGLAPNPYTIGAAAALSGFDLLNKGLGDRLNSDGTQDMVNTGYANFSADDLLTEGGKGKKGTLLSKWFHKGRTRDQNARIDSGKKANLLASDASYQNKQNAIASYNTTGTIQDKTDWQLRGGADTRMLAARMGTKIPPVNLRKIVNKASYKHQRGSVINRPDIKSINKLDIEPIKSTPGSTDFSNIISKALKSREEKLKAPETFEEYRLRIGKLNQNFLVDDPSYNLKGAYESKLEPTLYEDGTYHLSSRDPNTGKILKSPTHRSFGQTLAGEEEAGHVMYLKDGELYSAPKEQVSSSDREAAEQFIRKAMSKSYKDVGLLTKADKKEVIEEVVEEKMNVIPEGAFHSRKNNIHEDVAEHVTKKGIPVITKDEEGKVTQHAEVERNEIIFHKEATDTIESLHEKYKKAETQKLKDEIMIECGKYVADQILVNTDDRTGIIETIEYA